MTKEQWYEKAEWHQARMDEIGDPDDAIYQMHESKRNACFEAAEYAPESIGSD